MTVDPSGGVRAYAKPKNTEPVQYDFSIWIDTSSLPGPVSEVRYEFPDSRYASATSRLSSNGFAVYFRGVECPDLARVTIVLENDDEQTVDYGFCDAVR